MTVVSVMQPSFVGWAGYFAMIDRCDTFILDDQAQYVRKSWHSRNKIRTRDGQVVWVTVPVHAHRHPLNSILIDDTKGGRDKIARTIHAAYSHTPGWELIHQLPGLGHEPRWPNSLTTLTSSLIRAVADTLGITTPIVKASSLGPLRPDMHHRIVDMCRAVGADVLLNTPTARAYIDEDRLDGISVDWMAYTHPRYEQGTQEWEPYLSVIDLIAWQADKALPTIRSGFYDSTCETCAQSVRQ